MRFLRSFSQKHCRLFVTMVLVALSLAFASNTVFAFVQTAVPEAPKMPDWSATGVLVINALGAIAVTTLVAVIRPLVPKIPRIAVIGIVYALGLAAAWLATFATGGSLNPMVAALVALGAHAINEIRTTLDAHGFSS